MKPMILRVGKERNMTLPKDVTAKLGLSLDELVGASIVTQLEKVVTGTGRVIEGDALERLME